MTNDFAYMRGCGGTKLIDNQYLGPARRPFLIGGRVYQVAGGLHDERFCSTGLSITSIGGSIF